VRGAAGAIAICLVVAACSDSGKAAKSTACASRVTLAFASAGLPDEYQEQGDDIFVMSVDRAGRPRSAPRQVTTMHRAETPAVSPDGRHIVWADGRESDADASLAALGLWIMNVDGTAQRPLLKGDGVRYLAPAWSPTGKRIAVLQERRWTSPDFERNVVVVEPDGTGVETLFRVPANSNDTTLSWSPDGKRLVVSLFIDDGTSRAAQVRSIRVGDRHQTMLLAQQPSASSDLVLRRGAISPDGRRLLVRRGLGASQVRVLDVASHRQSDPLVTDLSTGGSQAWVPDGSAVLFTGGPRAALERVDLSTRARSTVAPSSWASWATAGPSVAVQPCRVQRAN
jgi:Periplasmic component of the Tol biopolymer transport system